MESTLKACLLHILEDLLEEELVKFKFQLTNITLDEGYNHIPRGIIQQANPVRLADLLIQYYGEEYSKTVTQEVLNAINQRNLAEKLCQAMEKCEKFTNGGKVGRKKMYSMVQ
ncbi:hypothetical protein FD755_017087 [Muntiacus reevesi]|uniref:Pyrin domain-containing protein n=1 Tax=Muntiacus reevesi TaxID=9886 RepID=A0A5N3XE10_MUNRE|nr:hypothetical protein FD755_017087 [Muntiacus reevesi]